MVKSKLLIVAFFLMTPVFFASAQNVQSDEVDGIYCPKLSTNIRIGYRDKNTNGQVSELQQFLVDYFNLDASKLIITGIFGRITKGYVSQFQVQNHLINTGIVGAVTRGKISQICTDNSDGLNTVPNPYYNTNPNPIQCPIQNIPACGGILTPSIVSGCVQYTCTATATSTPAGASCTVGSASVHSGTSQVFYNALSVVSPASCQSISRTCTNGSMSGDASYVHTSCSVQTPATCTFNGQTLASGSSTLAYQTVSVISPSVCVSETRTCSNGALSGSYSQPSCIVIPSTISANPFELWITDYGYHNATGQALVNSMNYYNLGKVGWNNNTAISSQGKKIVNFGEWDWMYYGLQPGQIDGSGHARDNQDCYGSAPGCYQSGPSSKVDGYNRLYSFWVHHVPSVNSAVETVASMVGHFNYSSYAAEFGAGILMAENGAGTGNFQTHMAFTRGAAKQYGKEWAMDFSSWFGPAAKHSLNTPLVSSGNTYCEYCGLSYSILKRFLYMSYYGGTNYIHDEGGGLDYFKVETPADGSGNLTLAPSGQIVKEFKNTIKNSPRSDAYVPVAILTDYRHGSGRQWPLGLVWEYIGFSNGDRDFYQVINNVFFPSSNVSIGNNIMEPEMMTTSLLDNVDIITDKATQNIINQYPILVVSGDVNSDGTLVGKLGAYLDNGGVVVLHGVTNSLYSSLATSAGRKVYSASSLYDIPTIVKTNLAKVAPVSLVSGSISMSLNKISSTDWYVLLINNTGVTKSYTSPEVIDSSKDTTAQVAINSGILNSISVIVGNTVTTSSDNKSFSVRVPAGEVSVVKININNTVSCVPDSNSPQTQTLSCPAGQTGSIIQTRTSSCLVGASTPTWSEWTTTGNSCTTTDGGNFKTVTQCLATIPNQNSFSIFDVWGQNVAQTSRSLHTVWEQVTGHSLYDGNLVSSYLNTPSAQLYSIAANSADATFTINLIWSAVTGEGTPDSTTLTSIRANLINGSANAKTTIAVASQWSGLTPKIAALFTAKNSSYALTSSDAALIINALVAGKIKFSNISSVVSCVIP